VDVVPLLDSRTGVGGPARGREHPLPARRPRFAGILRLRRRSDYGFAGARATGA
jgi:hypothetical protein